MKEKIESNKAPLALGPYSQAVQYNDLLFISGQLPIDRSTGELTEGIENQTRQSLTNIKYILEAANLDMSNILKTTVYLSDINNFTAMNEVYGTFFSGICPARMCMEVAALPKNALIEIEAIAGK